MREFKELTREDGLYEVEGGFVEVAGFVIAVIAFGYTWYDSAKDDAEKYGVRDAYIDMYFPK